MKRHAAIILCTFIVLACADAVAKHRDEPYTPADATIEERVTALEEHVKKMETMLQSTMMTRLEEYGHIVNRFGRFEVAIGATGVLQGSLRNEKNSPTGNNIAGNGSLDVTVTSAFSDHYVATARLEAGVYNGLDQTFTNQMLFGAVNADDIAPGGNLALNDAECFLEAKFFNEMWGFAIGLLDPAVFYDANTVANDETSQFLNYGFANNTTLDLPRNYAIGGLSTVKVGIFGISAGAFDAAASGMNLEDNLFWIGEVDLSPTVFDLKHNYRVYIWGNHDNLANHPRKFDTNKMGYGVGASFDQAVTKWLSFFERAGYARKSVYNVYLSFSGGAHISGSLYGRDDDTFGLAGGAAISNKSQFARNEYVVETYYNLGLAKGHVHVAPDIQFIVNPGGQSNLNNAFFIGARAQLDF